MQRALRSRSVSLPAQSPACYDRGSMLVLFSIAMICFFALFGMLIVLLRQAKAEGSLLRTRNLPDRGISRSRQPVPTSDTHARFGVSQSGLDLTLSNLVPSKQPDWRFMVREGSRNDRSDAFSHPSRGSAKKAPGTFDFGVSRPDRAYSNKDLGDLTDPLSSQSNIARRA